MAELKQKYKIFCDHYLITGDGAKAARKAGFSKKTAARIAYDVLQRSEVKEYLDEKRKKVSKKLEITHERIMAEYAAIAFSNIADHASWEDHSVILKSSSKMSRKKTAAISEISESVTERGVSKLKVKLHDKKGALDSLAKIIGLVIDRREISGPNGKPIEIQAKSIDLSKLSKEELVKYREMSQKIVVAAKKD